MGRFNSLNLWWASQHDLVVISRTCDFEFCLSLKPQGAWVLLCAQVWYCGRQWLGLQSGEQVAHCLRTWCFIHYLLYMLHSLVHRLLEHLWPTFAYLYQVSVSSCPGCGAADVKLLVWNYVDGYITTRPTSRSLLQLSAQLPAVRELPNFLAVQQKLPIGQKLTLHLHLTIQSVTSHALS